MTNWTDQAAPRFTRPAPGSPTPKGPALRVATFNLHFSNRLAQALEVVQANRQLAGADVLAVQEADERAVDRLADLLGAGYTYYPAVLHRRTGRNFGPALLSRWPILEDRKLILPHAGLHGMQRIAVSAALEVRGERVDAWAVHFGTMREILPHQQAAQARAVVKAIEHQGPAIVAGDLNRKGVGRVFEAAGWHWPTRDVGRTHLIWSFDHVFVRGFGPVRHAAGAIDAALAASDHRAVWAELPLGEHQG
jgi:endonuclease/exonuclease/phosphatase family metal-dependent hydrolase